MKYKKVSFLLCLAMLFGMLCQAEAKAPKYKLIWKEDFNGNRINEKYWSKIPRGGSEWSVHLSDHPSLYELKKGKLMLHGVQNNGILPNDTADYLTAGIYTKDKFTVGYGKVEVRTKLEGAQSAWPAIWMLPQGGRWPEDGEVDLMERLHKHDYIHQTVHSNYTEVEKETKNPPYGATPKCNPEAFNVYAVEILPDSLVFSINGKPTFSYPNIHKEGQYPFGTPYFLLIDMQIGATWMEAPDPKDYPIKMTVDWVKVYELEQ